MLLLACLGNPGTRYACTRHNAGFMFAEGVQQAYGFPTFKKQFNGLVTKGKVGAHEVLLLQPQTFMNLSGQSVQAACAFYKITPAQLWVVHDELDLALGKIKYKQGGGDAGHNGLRSITAALGANYHRLRLGIGRPAAPMEVEDYVLQNFSTTEQTVLESTLEPLVKQLPAVLEKPLDTLAKLGNLA